jgi:site-specific DNA recombinase
MSEAQLNRFLCLDCGADTSAIGEYYMLRDTVWKSINSQGEGMLCLDCAEKRLGRTLTPADFMPAEVNEFGDKSDRLLSRMQGNQAQDSIDKTALNSRKRAVIYCRVSTEEQRKRGTSISKQVDVCTRYATSHGFRIVDTFKDDFTGTVPIELRPEGGKAFAMLISGVADALIVCSIDRLVRPKEDGDEWDIPIMVRGLAKTGKEIHCADTGKIDNSFVGLLCAVFGGKGVGDERRRILQSLTDGKVRKARELKKWVGAGQTPYGYTKVGKGKDTYLEINWYQAQRVRRIFDLYLGFNGASASSMRRIAQLLNTKGISTTDRLGDVKDKPLADRIWSSGTVSKVLANRAYIGEFSWSVEVVTIPELAIIPRDVFDAAQVQRRINRPECKCYTKYDYLLRGRIFCACGRKMTVKNHREGKSKMYFYYRCSRNDYEPSPDCDCKMIPARLCDRVVWEWLVDVFGDPEKLLAGLRENASRQRDPTAPLRVRLAELPGLIADWVRQAKGLTISLAAKDRDNPDDALAIKALEERLALVSAAYRRDISEQDTIIVELAAAEVGEAEIQQILAWTAEIRTALGHDGISFEARRKILERLNVAVTIKYQNKVRGLLIECPALAYATQWRKLDQVKSVSPQSIDLTVSDGSRLPHLQNDHLQRPSSGDDSEAGPTGVN